MPGLTAEQKAYVEKIIKDLETANIWGFGKTLATLDAKHEWRQLRHTDASLAAIFDHVLDTPSVKASVQSIVNKRLKNALAHGVFAIAGGKISELYREYQEGTFIKRDMNKLCRKHDISHTVVQSHITQKTWLKLIHHIFP